MRIQLDLFCSRADPGAAPEILQRNPVVTGDQGLGAKEILPESVHERRVMMMLWIMRSSGNDPQYLKKKYPNEFDKYRSIKWQRP